MNVINCKIFLMYTISLKLAVLGNSGSRRLTRRPMETPGLDINNTPAQQPQYNYAQNPMYSQPGLQSSSQQQFYYNDFTSVTSQPVHGCRNNDFGYSESVQMDNTNHRPPHYASSINE